MPRILTRILCAALLAVTFTSCKKKWQGDHVINVESTDADMLAAIAKARETLPTFWQAFDHHEHGEERFALKVKITDSHGTEHFWLNNVERKDGKVFGTINNDADIVKSVKLDERIEILEPDISDWLFMRDDKMVGNYTLRVLFKQMPAEEVEKYKKLMVEP